MADRETTDGSVRRVVVCDDDALARRSVAGAVECVSGVVVCGEAGCCADALRCVRELSPDLLLLDLGLPDGSGIDLLPEIAAVAPSLPVLVMSVREEPWYVHAVVRAGGRGYVMKNRGVDEIITAVESVFAGGDHFSQGIAPMSTDSLGGAVNDILSRVSTTLTAREQQVFGLLGEGWGPSSIAERFSVGTNTVATHLQRIQAKLGLQSREDLRRIAVQWYCIQMNAAAAGRSDFS